jgi:hypothetical protein
MPYDIGGQMLLKEQNKITLIYQFR